MEAILMSLTMTISSCLSPGKGTTCCLGSSRIPEVNSAYISATRRGVSFKPGRWGSSPSPSRIRRTPNTVLSHRLVHWSAKNNVQDEVVGELFKLYFEEGRDIGDMETVVECAVRVGIDELRARRYLMGDEGRQEVVASDVYARRLGINGVPCFIVNRKYAVSGAQPPSAFVEVFNLAERDAATSAAQSTA